MATLIESLTALAVFAIGASASATWLAQSTAHTSQASARVRALAIASDMEARLRAHRAGVHAGHYRHAIPAKIDCRKACSPAQLAQHDLAAFHAALASAWGPGANGEVACDQGACLIRITWPGGALHWGVAP